MSPHIAGLRSLCRMSCSAFGERRMAVRPVARSTRVSRIAGVAYGGAGKNEIDANQPAKDSDRFDGYKKPSKTVLDLLDRPVPPSYTFSPDRTKVLKVYRPPPNPPLSEFIQPELKLAGLRIDPAQSSRARLGHSLSVALLNYDLHSTTEFISDLPETPLQNVPEGHVLNFLRWSPNGKRIAFTIRSLGGPGEAPRAPLALWVADVPGMQARPVLGDRRLQCIYEDYVWLDDDTLVASVIPEGRGDAPAAPAVPVGPKISDNSSGSKSQARTYPDLLKNEHDSQLLEWYTTAQLLHVNVATGDTQPLGPPRMYVECYPSPDGSLMIVSWIERPFSYDLPAGRFPRVWQVWDRDGNVVREVARLGLLDNIPIEFDATREGPRSISWRADKPAVLKWVEALDGGDPKSNPDTAPRDAVYAVDLAAGAGDAEPQKIATTDLRYGGIAWCDDGLAMLYESWWATRRSRVWTFTPGDASATPQLLFDRSYEDIYSDPGSPLYVRHPTLPTSILARVDGGRQLLMLGEGASPEGTRPYMETLDLDTKATQRIWQSQEPFLEAPVGTVLNEAAHTPHVTLDDLAMLITRETSRDPPQFHVKRFSAGGTESSEVQLTNEPHPTPQLRDLQREILQYSRADGVALNAELFLPPGYDKDKHGPLPCLLWAYPREYKSKEAAGQLDKSPFEFSGIGPSSPLVWLSRGYAVLSGPSLPIVAEGEEEPNDTYVQQLVAGVEAVVKEVVDRGVVDPERVAAGGHSYGAFMTANILAHCGHLFACGIAQSGAYNRTLTPFGFQAEQRTFWKAPDVYSTMAPFNNADKIDKPLLLIHGEADNNTGTFPLQSERMYAALKGHGCVTRLVLLPHESHGYRAYESVMHVLSEAEAWLQAHCPSHRDVFE
eukprot:jgi/Ulvmu1/12691/UM094_0049.1